MKVLEYDVKRGMHIHTHTHTYIRGRICLLLARTTTSVFSRITRSPVYILPLEVIHLFANAKASAY